jgi:D-amino peptidase
MNVFISADIEGIDGVMARTHWDPAGADYPRACGWMVAEVNAAIEGAIEAGAKRVVVKDAHNTATNINLEQLHPAAELISGWGPLGSMVEGIDERFDALFLIGYHARAMTADGTLAHTWSSVLNSLQLNGQTVGETGWACAFAGQFGVPLALVTGDDKLMAQVSEEIPAGYHTVVTKTGWLYNAAHMRPIADVRREIKEAAHRSLKDLKSLPVHKPALPVTVTLRFRYSESLKACAAVPNVERLAPDTFQCRAADFIEAQKYFATLMRLARD